MNVKISEELFLQLVKLFLLDDTSQYTACKNGIQAKFDKQYQRYLYSIYSNKKISKEEREKARQAYLDIKGIPDSFRF